MKKAEEIRSRLERRLRGRNKLATLGGIIRKVEMLVNDERSSAVELGEIVGGDAVLTAKVLHAVNSASAAINRRIGSISEAIVILGFNHVRSICSGLVVGGAVQDVDGVGICFSDLWRHSLGTAAGAEFLQKRFSSSDHHGDLFTAGLLCNIGRIMLLQWFEEESAAIMNLIESGAVSRAEAEETVLGVSHAEIGYWAAEFWQFDEKLAHIIRHHHGPASSSATDIVNLAYVVAQAKGVGNPGERRMVCFVPGIFHRLKIDEGSLDQIVRHLEVVYGELGPVFALMK